MNLAPALIAVVILAAAIVGITMMSQPAPTVPRTPIGPIIEDNDTNNTTGGGAPIVPEIPEVPGPETEPELEPGPVVIDDWCVPGAKPTDPSGGGDFGTVEGITQFEGKTYCLSIQQAGPNVARWYIDREQVGCRLLIDQESGTVEGPVPTIVCQGIILNP